MSIKIHDYESLNEADKLASLMAAAVENKVLPLEMIEGDGNQPSNVSDYETLIDFIGMGSSAGETSCINYHANFHCALINLQQELISKLANASELLASLSELNDNKY